jgi:hypothetical protein
MTQYTLCRRLGCPQDRSGWVHKISPPPEFDPLTVRTVVCRYAHCAGEGGEFDLRCSRGMSTHLYVISYVLGEARSSFVTPDVTDLCRSLLHQRPGFPSPLSVGALLHLQYTGHGDNTAQHNSQHSDRTYVAGRTNSSTVCYTGGWPPPREAPQPIRTSPFHRHPPPPTTQNSFTMNMVSKTFTETSTSHPSTWSNVHPTQCISVSKA